MDPRSAPTGLARLIGNTPLVELTHLTPKPGIRLFAKLEGFNLSGSVKDRIVLAMIEQAEREGVIQPGMTLYEASTGNTGIALAAIGHARGYQVRIVLPKGIVPSIPDLLTLYGAEVVWCEPRGGMRGAIEMAESLAKADGGHILGQFTQQVNVDCHYTTTGVEIADALDRVDAFVAGIGTGGTLMGVGKRLREKFPNVRIVGVEPKLGDRLQGLRSLVEGYIPPLLDLTQMDGRYLVDSATAIAMARRVVEEEGIFSGVSSGATLHGAYRVAERMEEGTIVVMFSDGGWKYLPARPWDAIESARESLDEVHWW